MNLKDPKYSKYALVQEMTQTVQVVKEFDPNRTKVIAEEIIKKSGLDYTIIRTSGVLAKGANFLDWLMNSIKNLNVE